MTAAESGGLGALLLFRWIPDPVGFHFSINGRQANIEQPGRLRLIAFGEVQDTLDMGFFYRGQIEQG